MEHKHSHHTTLAVACPECHAGAREYCTPKHRKYKYDGSNKNLWTHKARHTSYEISLEALPKLRRWSDPRTYEDAPYMMSMTLTNGHSWAQGWNDAVAALRQEID